MTEVHLFLSKFILICISLEPWAGNKKNSAKKSLKNSPCSGVDAIFLDSVELVDGVDSFNDYISVASHQSMVEMDFLAHGSVWATTDLTPLGDG